MYQAEAVERKRRKGKWQLAEETHALHFQTTNKLKVLAEAGPGTGGSSFIPLNATARFQNN